MKGLKKIKKEIELSSKETIRQIQKISKIKYKRLILFFILIILAYFVFRSPHVSDFIIYINNYGYGYNYIIIFLAGMLIAFGFSAPFAIGYFIVSSPPNTFLAALTGGVGALLADLLIFAFVRVTLNDEFQQIKKTKLIRKTKKIIERNIGVNLTNHLMYVFAEIVIATPLPDELGVSMLAGLTKIKYSFLALISFVVHTIAIYVLLALTV